VGFVMGGLCPGTSCVAAASGKLDALALIAGMLGGTFLFGEVYPLVARLYNATPMGRFMLPQLLHLPEGVVVLLVAGMAGGCFALLPKFVVGAARSGRPSNP
jgi:hypothetical protein